MEIIILEFQLQVAFFHLFSVFTIFLVPIILQTTATNFPEMISKFCSKVL